MPNTEQLLYQTEKKQPLEVFNKNAVLKNFARFTGKHLCEIFKDTCFEEHLHMAASELALWSDCLELCFWIAFKTISTQYYKNTSCFQIRPLKKQNLAYMSSIYSTPKLSCEPGFCMFIINSYDLKGKHL